MYKSSFYNVIVPVPERNEYLLYNTLYGGYSILQEKEGMLFNRIIEEHLKFDLDYFNGYKEVFEKLADGKYIVNEDLNETEEYKKYYDKNKEAKFYDKEGRFILTIAPTNDCNMACPYCFEFSKIKGQMKKEDREMLVPFLESVMTTYPNIEDWKVLGVTWYGGEPLIAPKIIDELSEKLIAFADEHGMKYSADVITNGIFLNEENIAMLERNKVNVIQVTVDGPKKTHDKSRPLKNPNLPNYEKILDNIAKIPDSIRITFRMNVDREVADNIEELLDDLEEREIWPHKRKTLSLTAAWKRTYSENENDSKNGRFSYLEYFAWEQEFRKLKLARYNKWAEKNGLPPAKLRWDIPQAQFEECWTIVSPFTFVIDCEGYTHNCWENIQDRERRIQHISEPYDKNNFHSPYHLDYNRFKLNPEHEEYKSLGLNCNECIYLPVCGDVSCAQFIENKRFNCNEIKENFVNSLKNQYLIWTENPEIIEFDKDIGERSCLK